MTDHFNDYFFASNLTGYVCPGFGSFKCEPKGGACARDTNTGKRYCCDYADVCWGQTTTCASDGSTIDCGDGSNSWCCLNGSEMCTQTSGQINICWSSAHDTLTNISSGSLNSLFSSLSSASPTASSYTFDPLKLIAATATTSSKSQSTASSSGMTSTSPSSSTTSSSSSASAPANSSPSSSLSGGVIAGIVIAILAALALLVGGFFFFHRRRKQNHTAVPEDMYAADAKVHPGEPGDQYSDTPQELSTGEQRSELPASYAKVPAMEPQELPAYSTK